MVMSSYKIYKTLNFMNKNDKISTKTKNLMDSFTELHTCRKNLRISQFAEKNLRICPTCGIIFAQFADFSLRVILLRNCFCGFAQFANIPLRVVLLHLRID